MANLREVIRKKTRLLLVQKGVEVTPKSKSFGVFFGGPSFGHYGGKGRGLNLFQKCLGSFEVALRLFCGSF